jgi:hypothetical protein
MTVSDLSYFALKLYIVYQNVAVGTKEWTLMCIILVQKNYNLVVRKPIASQILKKFHKFYRIWRFMITATRALHWSLFWGTSIQPALPDQNFFKLNINIIPASNIITRALHSYLFWAIYIQPPLSNSVPSRYILIFCLIIVLSFSFLQMIAYFKFWN